MELKIDDLIGILNKQKEIERAAVFCIYISDSDPLAFNKKDSRYLPITSVKIQIKQSIQDRDKGFELTDYNFKTSVDFIKYNKKEILTSTKIPYDKFGYTPLHIYLEDRDAIIDYEKIIIKAVKDINKYEEKVLNDIQETKDKLIYSTRQ